MRALLKAELLKLRTTRTFVALCAVAVATSALLVVITALAGEPTEDSVLVEVFASDTSSLFILLLAIIGITGEWRHRTIAASLLAAPDRVRFLVAKTAAFAAAGIALSVTISAVVALLGYLILEARNLPVPGAGDVLALMGRNALVAAVLGAFGVGLGALVRNQVAGVVTVLVASFAIEPALVAVLPELARFGPFFALPTGMADISGSELGLDVDLLAPGPAALAMFAWVVGAFAAGAALLRYRDLE